MTRQPILLLVNPVAGGKPGSGPDLAEDPERLTPDALCDALTTRGVEVRLHVLDEDDDAGQLAQAAAADGCDVVVAGGDGTVSGVAAAMIGQETSTLGILAMGSFNNMARGFEIPVTLDAALDVIAAGRSVEMDCGWVVREGEEGRPFFEAAGVGIDAIGFLAVEVAERRGWLRAARSLVRAMRVRKTPMRITLDDTAYRTGGPAATVSNGPYHGMGFAVSNADPTDGLFNVSVFHGMSRWEVIRHFLAIARRQERREPRIRHYQATRVKIEGIRQALPAHADGVSIGVTPVTFEVRPKALRVFR